METKRANKAAPIQLTEEKAMITSCSYCGDDVEDDEVGSCPDCGQDDLCPGCQGEFDHDCEAQWDDDPDFDDEDFDDDEDQEAAK